MIKKPLHKIGLNKIGIYLPFPGLHQKIDKFSKGRRGKNAVAICIFYDKVILYICLTNSHESLK